LLIEITFLLTILVLILILSKFNIIVIPTFWKNLIFCENWEL
jgi:uncharacterized protein YqhQ